MPLDANGIWIYAEGESASLASVMLNRLASSVSTKVGQIVASLTGRSRSGNVAATTGAASGEITVAFSSALASTSYAVAITDTNTAAGIGAIAFKVRAKTTAGFTVRLLNPSTNALLTSLSTTFDYTATMNS